MQTTKSVKQLAFNATLICLLAAICLAWAIHDWQDRDEYSQIELSRLAKDGTLEGNLRKSKKGVDQLILCVPPVDYWARLANPSEKVVEVTLGFKDGVVTFDTKPCTTLKSMRFPHDHFWFIPGREVRMRLPDGGPNAQVRNDFFGYVFEGIELDEDARGFIDLGVAITAVVHTDGKVKASKVLTPFK